MAQAYIVTSVRKTPKEWNSKYGPMKTWLVALEGFGEPVQINQKAETPAPVEGQEITGTIEETEFGNKFKKEAPAFSGGRKQYEQRPDHHEEIKAQWAIGQAMTLEVETFKPSGGFNWVQLERSAKQLYAMVDRVKGSSESTYPKAQDQNSTNSEQSQSEQTSTNRKQPARDWGSVGKAESPEEVESLMQSYQADNINLDDIPF